MSEPGGHHPASPYLSSSAGNECVAAANRGYDRQYSIQLSNHKLVFLNNRFLLKGHSNILKIFQIILATTTEVTELESLLLNNAVSLVIDRSSHCWGGQVFFR